LRRQEQPGARSGAEEEEKSKGHQRFQTDPLTQQVEAKKVVLDDEWPFNAKGLSNIIKRLNKMKSSFELGPHLGHTIDVSALKNAHQEKMRKLLQKLKCNDTTLARGRDRRDAIQILLAAKELILRQNRHSARLVPY